MITVAELLREGEIHLQSLESARLDAELLLCNIMQVDRARLYAAPDTDIPSEAVTEFRKLISIRGNGKPLAYLTGKKEFWSHDFLVNEYTLVPRPETEIAVQTALANIPPGSELDIADLGTGSGAIAIAIAIERPQCRITATDICYHTIKIALANARQHGVNNINFVTSNWFENLQKRFDLIISNPPYLKDDDSHFTGDGIRYEPELALKGGRDGLDAIKAVISGSPGHLNAGGHLVLEHGYDQAEQVRSLFCQSGFTEINTFYDYAGIERVTSAIYKHA